MYCNKGSYWRVCNTVLNAGRVWSCLTYVVRHAWCGLDRWLLCMPCLWRSVCVGNVPKHIHIHTPWTHQCCNGCLRHTLWVYDTYLCHMICMWPHPLYRLSPFHQPLKLVSQSAPHCRSWQWVEALPLSLLPSLKQWQWADPWKK